MSDRTRFTAGEAAFVLHEPIQNAKKAFDTGPVVPVLGPGPDAPVRTIGRADLFYLFLAKALREDLTPKGRAALYEASRLDRFTRDDEVRFGRFRVAVADIIDNVTARIAALAELADKVEVRDDGVAVLKGHSIEVHRLASLLEGGLSVNAVIEDFPFLSREEVETARTYADIYPKRGRPYPRITAVRARRVGGLPTCEDVPWDDASMD